jgi:hypothetical protein
VTREEVIGWVNDIARWIETAAGVILGVLVVVGVCEVLSGASVQDAIRYPPIRWVIGIGLVMSFLRLTINRVFPPPEEEDEEGPELNIK